MSIRITILLFSVVFCTQMARAQAAKGPGGPPEGPPPAAVRVGQADERSLQERWPVSGRLREVKRVIVSAEQQGRLVEVSVEEGERVQSDTVLARIEEIWARLSLQTAEAQVKQVQASVAERQALLERERRNRVSLEDMGRSGSSRPKEVADALSLEVAREAQLKSAQASLAESDTEVRRVQTELEKLQVLAPFDGVVVRKMVEVGQYVERGDQVAEIISRGKIDAVIDVPEKLINQVKVGLQVEVMIEPLDRALRGPVIWIVPDASSSARTFPVKVRLDDEDGALKPGMSVTARIPSAQISKLLTVPRNALIRSASGSVVWVNQNDTAVKAQVRLLFSQDDRYAVQVLPGPGAAALKDGASVVIEGGERIFFPGQSLNVVGDGSAP